MSNASVSSPTSSGAAAKPGSNGRTDSILAGAAAAFSEKGYAATSMREVAQRTGASLGSIYYHFASKEDILRALIADNFSRVHASARHRLEGIDDPELALQIFVANHIEFFARHLDEMRVMSHELDTLGGAAGREVSALRDAYTGTAVEILAQLRPDLPEPELHIRAMCLFGMLNWTYRWFHTVDAKIGAAGLAQRMATLYLSGLDAR